MNKLLKYCQTGGNGVIAEAGEFYKDENGQIKQINPNTVTHDNYILIDEQGNPISKMPYNQGGVAVNGVQNVLSASHENREKHDKSYKQADEDIRIKPKEGKEFAKRFNFNNIKFNGGSPSKLFDSVLDAKTKKLKKYNNIEYNENSPYGINSSKANGAYVESLPQDEMIYDEIFNYQESKKQENDSSTMQTGGKSKEYWKNFDWTKENTDLFNPHSLKTRPNLIYDDKFLKSNQANGYYNREFDDLVYGDDTNNQSLRHEMEHRNSNLMSDSNRNTNFNILSKLTNTPPLHPFFYNRMGNPEELNAYIEGEQITNPEYSTTARNFITDENIHKYKMNKFKQRGGNILYVNSKNHPRYKAYQDSLSLYNKGKIDKDNFLNIINMSNIDNKYIDESQIKEDKKISPIKFGTLNHSGFKSIRQPNGSYLRSEYYGDAEVPENSFMDLKIKEGYKLYKKPSQSVKVLQRNKINNLNQLKSIPYQPQEIGYEYPDINYQVSENTDFYNPERVVGSEYNQNPDASYGKFKQRKSEYYDKQLQKMNRQVGGKGTLSPYPEMYGKKPVAMVNIKGKLYPASSINGRIVSIDDVFNKRDSVELKNFKAIKLNKNEKPKK